MDRNMLADIKGRISQGQVQQAIAQLQELIPTLETGADEAYYLLGNAYRKQGNWQQALNNYRYALDINPHSPAAQAHRIVMDILEFYNKDMYNQ